MAKLTLSEAARACNVARTTIQRAVKTGRLSLDAEHQVDTAEILRVAYQLDAAALHAASQHDFASTQQHAAPQNSTTPPQTAAAHDVQLLRQERDALQRERDLLTQQLDMLRDMHHTTQQQLTQAQQMLHEMQHRYDRLREAPRHAPAPAPPRPGAPGARMAPPGAMRRRIVALLQEHPAGLTPAEIRREILPGKGPGTQAHQGPQLVWWAEQLGRLRLDQVTPARLAACKDRLAQTRAPGTVNRYLAALSHALNTAVVEWGWIEASPLQRVRRLREPRGRVRYLTDAERPRLLAACQASHNRCLYPVVLLALSTGARKQEILSLTWRDIDLRRAQLTLSHTKNGEPRTLPLVGLALETVHTLARVRRIDTPLLFARTDGRASLDVRYAFQQALREADIADFRFHDLRHSFASYLAMQGASLLEMAEALGHKTLAMVKRYTHLSEAHTAGVVARMNAAIFP